ncbi:MAG: hypothetical protein WDZ83_07515 [Rhizobiaceae bacterium]
MTDSDGETKTYEDFRPFHRTSTNTVWGQVFAMRDNCHAAIVSALEQAGIQALVTKSPNGVYPPHIKLEAWNAQAGRNKTAADPRLRCALELRFQAMPYHEHLIATNARASVGSKTITINNRPDFSAADAAEWALYATGVGTRKPRNYAPFSDAVHGLFAAMVPFLPPPHRNRVERRYRNAFRMSLPLLLMVSAAGLGFVGFGPAQEYSTEGLGGLLILVAAVMAILAVVVASRRKQVISVIDRPAISPRHLLLVDSWHAVIPELGGAADELQRKIVDKLRALSGAGITTEVERYGYRTPNGFDERDRIVVSKEQSVAHIHIYRFGGDLFIGWDSYLNWARWVETGAISARREGRVRVEYRGLQTGIYIPNQFDLIDLNSLAEVVHRSVTTIIKAAMDEHKIDQEIDFTIIRGDRDSALDKDKFDRRNKREKEQAAPKRRWRVS